MPCIPGAGMLYFEPNRGAERETETELSLWRTQPRFHPEDEQENPMMAENEKPDFTVVDRRQAAQAEETPPSQAPTSAPPATSETADAPVSAEEKQASSEPAEAETEQEPEEGSFGLPDPALLIAWAAMQTSPQKLLGLLAPSFDSQARYALGLIADPQTGEMRQDMDAAKVAIDAVQFCLSRAEPTLEAAEHREMMRRLNDLRLTYVAKLQTS
jgi:hypothetical protein